MSSDGKISIDLVANEKGFTAQLDSIAATTRKAFGSLMGGLTSVLMGKGLVDTAAKAIELASAAQQTANRVNSVFPEMADTINAFASRAMTDMGMGGGAAKDMAAKFGMMAQGMGFTEKQAANMSMQMTQLAGDLAAFYGITTDEAQSRLSGVFTGMTRGLKTMGVNMSDANLQAHALALGIQQDISTMSEAQLAALRLSYAQQQLATVSGYAKQNLGTWAGQTALLRQQTNALLASMGKGLIAVFLPVLKVINAVIGGLIQVANAFNAMIERITGKKFGEMMGGAAGVTLDLSGAASSAGESTGGLADAQGRAAKAADKQDKAQRKLNRTLAGFDKITKLTSDAANKALGGTGGLGGVGGLGVDPLGFGGLMEDAEEAQQSLDGIKVPPALEKALKRLGKAFSELFGVLAKAGKWAYDNVLKPLAKWTVNKLLPAIIDLLAAAFRVLAKVLKGLAPIGKAVWNYFLKPLAKFAGDAIIAMLQGLAGALEALADFAGKHPKALNAIAGGLAAVFAVSKLKGAGGFAGLIAKLAGKFRIFFAAIMGKGGVAGLGKLGKALVGLIKKFPIKNPLILALTALVAVLGYVYKNWNKIRKTKVGQAIERLGKKLAPIGGKIGKSVEKLLGKLADLAEKLWKALKPVVEKVLDKVLDWAGKAAEALGDTLCTAIDGLCGFIDLLAQGWDAIEPGVKELGVKAVEIGEGALKALGDAWNGITEGVKEIGLKLLTFGGELWDNIMGFWNSITGNNNTRTLTANVKTNTDGNFADVKSAFSTSDSWLKDKKGTLTANANGSVSDGFNGAKGAFEWGTGKSFKTTSNTITGLVKAGVDSAWSTAKGAFDWGSGKTFTTKTNTLTGKLAANVADTWSTVKNAFNWASDEENPGTPFTNKTKTLTGTLAAGVASTWQTAKNAFDWASDEENPDTPFVSRTKTLTGKLVSKGVGESWNSVKKAFNWSGEKGTAFTSKSKTLTGTLKSSGVKSFDGAKSAFNWAAGGKFTNRNAWLQAGFTADGYKKIFVGMIQKAWNWADKNFKNMARWLQAGFQTMKSSTTVQGGSVGHAATGAWVARNTPRLVVIGDNTREGELVSPESKFQSMLDKAAASGGTDAQTLAVLNAILQAIQASDRAVYLDGREISRRVVRDVNAITQATGRSPIIV